MISILNLFSSLRRPRCRFSTQTTGLFAPQDHVVSPPVPEMDRMNPRIEMNVDVNMFSHFSQVCPLTRIPVFKLYEYCPVGVAERVVRGVIFSGARTPRFHEKVTAQNG